MDINCEIDIDIVKPYTFELEFINFKIGFDCKRISIFRQKCELKD